MVPGVFFCSPILEPGLKRASRAPRGGKLMKHDKHQQKSMAILNFGKSLSVRLVLGSPFSLHPAWPDAIHTLEWKVLEAIGI